VRHVAAGRPVQCRAAEAPLCGFPQPARPGGHRQSGLAGAGRRAAAAAGRGLPRAGRPAAAAVWRHPGSVEEAAQADVIDVFQRDYKKANFF